MKPEALSLALLMLASVAAEAAEVGRLFFTPEQRVALDSARKQAARSLLPAEKEAPSAESVRLSGVVRRSDGRSTVWVNNEVVNEARSDGINVRPTKDADRVRVTMPETGKSVELKVGQSAEVVTGTIQENYARRPAPPLKAEPKPVENAPSTTGSASPSAGSQPTPSSGQKSSPRTSDADEGSIRAKIIPEQKPTEQIRKAP